MTLLHDNVSSNKDVDSGGIEADSIKKDDPDDVDNDESRTCPDCKNNCSTPNKCMLDRVALFVKTFITNIRETLSPLFAADKEKFLRSAFLQEFSSPTTSLALEHHVQKPIVEWFPHLLMKGK